MPQNKEAEDVDGKLKEAQRKLKELEAADAAEKERLKQIASGLDSESLRLMQNQPSTL